MSIQFVPDCSARTWECIYRPRFSKNYGTCSGNGGTGTALQDVDPPRRLLHVDLTSFWLITSYRLGSDA